MKVIIWPSGREDDAVAQYRLILPAQALRDQGADVTIGGEGSGPALQWSHRFPKGQNPPDYAKVMGLAAKPDADVVVIQRPALRFWTDAIPMLQKAGVRVVVDVDDLFSNLHRNHAGRDGYDPNASEVRNYQWVDHACRLADMVTCTTPLLKQRYGYGHGLIIPNFVPERYLRIEAFRRPKTMGWTGSIFSHPADLQVTNGAVGQVCDSAGWKFHHVGTGLGIKDGFRLSEEPTNTGDTWVPFIKYPEYMAELSLGLVPLEDSRFNQAKSCLKMMEFASLGVPVAASSIPDNVRLHGLGIGSLVTHPSHWRKVLKSLVNNDERRRDMAGRGREAMADLTYEKQCWRWGFAWGCDRDRIHAPAMAAS